MLEDLRMNSHPAAGLDSNLGTVPQLLEAQTLLCCSAWCGARHKSLSGAALGPACVSLGVHTPGAGTATCLGCGWTQLGSKSVLVWDHQLLTAGREDREDKCQVLVP